MSESHNILSLDVGERRIGVALASLEARIATPLLTIDRLKQPEVFKVISELVSQYKAETVVIGLPRGMSGQDTAQTNISRDFATELSKHIEATIAMQDEAGTSLAAEEELKALGKAYQKADIDSRAAAIILRDWLVSNQLGVIN